MQSRRSYVETMILSFSDALRDFVRAQGHSFTIMEDISVAVLQLHALDARVSLHLKQGPQPFGPQRDAMMLQMREMISIGKRIVAFVSNDSKGLKRPPSFCLDMGFVIPLYTVASQAPEPSLRQEAITLLRSAPRQEGLWNSTLVANAAQRIMEIEEAEGARLVGDTDSPSGSHPETTPVVLQLDTRGGHLRYISQANGGSGMGSGKVIERIFDW